MRRGRRRIGTVLVAVGLLTLAYTAAVLLWRDPVTDLYTRFQQHRLAEELQRSWPAYETGRLPVDFGGERDAAVRTQITDAAHDFQDRLQEGHPLGRLEIPSLGLDAVVVQGTDWGRDLSKGPGHYTQTSVPGLDGTTAIAGHRTTFGAPFRKIDELGAGDELVLELPYGTFRYRAFAHDVVKSNDWSIIRPRGYDTLVLSACHPLYSASHRWVVYARLVRVEPTAGTGYTLAAR